MTTDSFTYERGSELPGLELPWQEETAANTFTDLDLSSGYTFIGYLIDDAGSTALTKTTSITGNDGSVTVAWDVGDLDVAAGQYRFKLQATEVATSKQRWYRPGSPIVVNITE